MNIYSRFGCCLVRQLPTGSVKKRFTFVCLESAADVVDSVVVVAVVDLFVVGVVEVVEAEEMLL